MEMQWIYSTLLCLLLLGTRANSVFGFSCPFTKLLQDCRREAYVADIQGANKEILTHMKMCRLYNCLQIAKEIPDENECQSEMQEFIKYRFTEDQVQFCSSGIDEAKEYFSDCSHLQLWKQSECLRVNSSEPLSSDFSIFEEPPSLDQCALYKCLEKNSPYCRRILEYQMKRFSETPSSLRRCFKEKTKKISPTASPTTSSSEATTTEHPNHHICSISQNHIYQMCIQGLKSRRNFNFYHQCQSYQCFLSFSTVLDPMCSYVLDQLRSYMYAGMELCPEDEDEETKGCQESKEAAEECIRKLDLDTIQVKDLTLQQKCHAYNCSVSVTCPSTQTRLKKEFYPNFDIKNCPEPSGEAMFPKEKLSANCLKIQEEIKECGREKNLLHVENSGDLYFYQKCQMYNCSFIAEIECPQLFAEMEKKYFDDIDVGECFPAAPETDPKCLKEKLNFHSCLEDYYPVFDSPGRQCTIIVACAPFVSRKCRKEFELSERKYFRDYDKCRETEDPEKAECLKHKIKTNICIEEKVSDKSTNLVWSLPLDQQCQLINCSLGTLENCEAEAKAFQKALEKIGIPNCPGINLPFVITTDEPETTLPTPIPEKPQNFSVGRISSQGIELEWSQPIGYIDGYRIYFQDMYGILYQETFEDKELTNIKYSIKQPLTAYSNYIIWVTSFASDLESEPSNKITVRTDVAGPSEPLNVTVTCHVGGMMIVHWQKPKTFAPSVDEYRVSYYNPPYRFDKVTEFKIEAVNNKLDQMATFSNLDGDRTYEVRVAGGTRSEIYPTLVRVGSYSDAVSCTIPLALPLLPRITSVEPMSGVFDKQVEIPCTAEGSPPPTITWYVRSDSDELKQIHNSSRIYSTSQTLVISSVRFEDEGSFICEAKNNFGTDLAEIPFTVAIPRQMLFRNCHNANKMVDMCLNDMGFQNDPIETEVLRTMSFYKKCLIYTCAKKLGLDRYCANSALFLESIQMDPEEMLCPGEETSLTFYSTKLQSIIKIERCLLTNVLNYVNDGTAMNHLIRNCIIISCASLALPQDRDVFTAIRNMYIKPVDLDSLRLCSQQLKGNFDMIDTKAIISCLNHYSSDNFCWSRNRVKMDEVDAYEKCLMQKCWFDSNLTSVCSQETVQLHRMIQEDECSEDDETYCRFFFDHSTIEDCVIPYGVTTVARSRLRYLTLAEKCKYLSCIQDFDYVYKCQKDFSETFQALNTVFTNKCEKAEMLRHRSEQCVKIVLEVEACIAQIQDIEYLPEEPMWFYRCLIFNCIMKAIKHCPEDVFAYRNHYYINDEVVTYCQENKIGNFSSLFNRYTAIQCNKATGITKEETIYQLNFNQQCRLYKCWLLNELDVKYPNEVKYFEEELNLTNCQEDPSVEMVSVSCSKMVEDAKSCISTTSDSYNSQFSYLMVCFKYPCIARLQHICPNEFQVLRDNYFGDESQYLACSKELGIVDECRTYLRAGFECLIHQNFKAGQLLEVLGVTDSSRKCRIYDCMMKIQRGCPNLFLTINRILSKDNWTSFECQKMKLEATTPSTLLSQPMVSSVCRLSIMRCQKLLSSIDVRRNDLTSEEKCKISECLENLKINCPPEYFGNVSLQLSPIEKFTCEQEEVTDTTLRLTTTIPAAIAPSTFAPECLMTMNECRDKYPIKKRIEQWKDDEKCAVSACLENVKVSCPAETYQNIIDHLPGMEQYTCDPFRDHNVKILCKTLREAAEACIMMHLNSNDADASYICRNTHVCVSRLQEECPEDYYSLTEKYSLTICTTSNRGSYLSHQIIEFVFIMPFTLLLILWQIYF